MALNFPPSPTNGQIYYDPSSGNRYIFRSATGVWVYSANNEPIASNTQILYNDGGNIVGSNSVEFFANTLYASNVAVSDNVTARYYYGNGAFLTGVSPPIDLSPPFNQANAAFEKANTVVGDFVFTNNRITTTNTAYDSSIAIGKGFNIISNNYLQLQYNPDITASSFQTSNSNWLYIDNTGIYQEILSSPDTYAYPGIWLTIYDENINRLSGLEIRKEIFYATANTLFRASANGSDLYLNYQTFSFGLSSGAYYAFWENYFQTSRSIRFADDTYQNTAFTNTAANNIVASFVHANAAFDKANTGGTISGDMYVTGNVTVLKDLNVTGNVTFTNTKSLIVSDPLLYLAGNNYTSDLVDIGFVANYVNATSVNVHTGLYRSSISKQYYLFQGYDKEPDGNYIDYTGNNFTLATLNATLVTSNLTLGGSNAISWITAAFNKANSGGAVISNTAPSSPSQGSLWWNNIYGRLFVYYTDEDNTSQWVDATPSQLTSLSVLSNTISLVFGVANTAFANANGTHSYAISAYNTANLSYNTANAAFSNANGTHSFAIASYNTANAAFSNANGTHSFAISAFNAANTKLSNGSIFINGTVRPLALNETQIAPTISASSLTLDCSTGNIFKVNLNSSITTLTFSNVPAANNGYGMVLSLTADGTARTITWPLSVKWPSNTAPTLTSTNAKVDTFVLLTWDSGTNWYAFVSGQNA